MFSSESGQDPRKKFFHYEHASVPITCPTEIGTTHTYEIPFGPPLIHLEPEKTASFRCDFPFPFPQTPSKEPSPLRDKLGTDSMNDHFFNIGGQRIYTFPDDEEYIPAKEDEKMEEE